jgi:acetyl esterase
VFVNYTRSPEAPYPVAINQAYAATEWVAEYGEKINVDGSRLAVVGNSAGGNIAAVVSLMAKDKGTPALRSQILLWPVTMPISIPSLTTSSAKVISSPAI